MITCEKCFKILMTVQESEEIYVRGEVQLNVFCQSCNTVNYIKLYEYNKDRIKRGV